MIIRFHNLCTYPIKIGVKQNNKIEYSEAVKVEDTIDFPVVEGKGSKLVVQIVDHTYNDMEKKSGVIMNAITYIATSVWGEHPTFKSTIDDKKVLTIECVSDDSDDIVDILVMHSEEENIFAVSKNKNIRVRQRYDIEKKELKNRVRGWYLSCGIESVIYDLIFIICAVWMFQSAAPGRWEFLLLTIGFPTLFIYIHIKNVKRDCREIGRRRLMENGS